MRRRLRHLDKDFREFERQARADYGPLYDEIVRLEDEAFLYGTRRSST